MKKALAVGLIVAIAGALATTATAGSDRVRDAAGTSTLAPTAGDSARAVARRAREVYVGRFTPEIQNGSFMALQVTKRGKNVKKVLRMAYLAGMRCPSHPGVLVAPEVPVEWDFRPGFRVKPSGRFRIAGQDENDARNRVVFTGRFSDNGKRVRGTLKAAQFFPEDPPEFPAEVCTLPRTKYRAKLD